MVIFVGNLSFLSTEDEVRNLFAGFGEVVSVAIVMDKKGKKSRGFGFVDMVDEQQGLAAIAALDKSDFMGRPLNVSPSVPKNESGRDLRQKEKKQAKIEKRNVQEPGLERGGINPFLRKPGTYKGGRRTRSYMKKRMDSGVDGPIPEREVKPNPLRWRRKVQARPGRKLRSEVRPEGAAKPWEKSRSSESRPWRKPEGESRPWKKSEGTAKPWDKSSGGESRPWRKPEGESRPYAGGGARKPWQKSRSSESRPWKKPEGGGARTWSKEGAAKPRSEGPAKPWQRRERRPRPGAEKR